MVVFKALINTVITSLICSSAFLCLNANAIGKVSRDCPGAGAKESISMDWTGRGEYFYTESYAARPTNGDFGRMQWVKSTSGSGYKLVSRSYAGDVANFRLNNYYSAVQGFHYRRNRDTGRTEFRETYVRFCDLLTWGVQNW